MEKAPLDFKVHGRRIRQVFEDRDLAFLAPDEKDLLVTSDLVLFPVIQICDRFGTYSTRQIGNYEDIADLNDIFARVVGRLIRQDANLREVNGIFINDAKRFVFRSGVVPGVAREVETIKFGLVRYFPTENYFSKTLAGGELYIG